jgi:hypothetical protein
MKAWTVLLVALLLAACASATVAAARREPVQGRRIRAGVRTHRGERPVRDEPRNEAVHEPPRSLQVAKGQGRSAGTVRALYSKGQLKLEYDSAKTRNAAQAFAARSGNCLSLVIMTAAFAKEMGLPVTYQSAFLDESWGRSGDIHFFIGHVNVTLGPHLTRLNNSTNLIVRQDETDLTIDFLLPRELRGLNTRVIDERPSSPCI